MEIFETNRNNHYSQCVLCGNGITGKEYDAYPVENGPCCHRCDFDIVIPARAKFSRYARLGWEDSALDEHPMNLG